MSSRILALYVHTLPRSRRTPRFTLGTRRVCQFIWSSDSISLCRTLTAQEETHSHRSHRASCRRLVWRAKPPRPNFKRLSTASRCSKTKKEALSNYSTVHISSVRYSSACYISIRYRAVRYRSFRYRTIHYRRVRFSSFLFLVIAQSVIAQSTHCYRWVCYSRVLFLSL